MFMSVCQCLYFVSVVRVGLGTGSVHCANKLRVRGFPFECETERVIVVKTHRPGRKFDKAIVIIRNPLDAIFSLFQYKRQGFHGHVSKEVFDGKLNNMHVDNFPLSN